IWRFSGKVLARWTWSTRPTSDGRGRNLCDVYRCALATRETSNTPKVQWMESRASSKLNVKHETAQRHKDRLNVGLGIGPSLALNEPPDFHCIYHGCFSVRQRPDNCPS